MTEKVPNLYEYHMSNLHLSYESKEIKEITINLYSHRLILTTLNNRLEGCLLRIGQQNEVTSINFQYILKHTRLYNQDLVNIRIQSQWKHECEVVVLYNS